MKLYINSLGNFEVTDGERSLLEESTRKYKLYRLVQYFLTFRDKKLLPETIIDHLFSDIESNDPKNVLRAQIFRLRKELKEVIPEDVQESDYIGISFSNGYYLLEIGDKVVLDVDEFENLISMGDRAETLDKAAEFYYAATNLYRGEYLAGNPYESWLVPTRNYYRRMYLKAIYRLIEILNDSQRYEHIVEICEKALIIEKYEESLHIHLIEAMLNMKQINNAKSHYEYMTSMMDKEMGVKSSSAIKGIYRKIQNFHNEKPYIDIDNIMDKLGDEESKGAFLCETEYFKSIYDIQKRRASRASEDDYILIITFDVDIHSVNHDAQYIKSWGKQMTNILKTSLRAGDVFTFWNEMQILALLHDVKDNGIQIIEQRLRSNIGSSLSRDTKLKHTKLITSSILTPSPY